MTEDDQVLDHRLVAAALTGGRIRALVLDLWQRTRLDWGFVNDRLSQVFRKETWVGGSERRFMSEVVYGLVRHVRRVDAALAAGRRGTSSRAPSDDERLIAYFVLEGAITAAAAAPLAPSIDWAVVADFDATLARERDPVVRVAVGCSMPDWLARRLVRDHGPRAEAIARALGRRAPTTIRANRLRTTRTALAGALAARGLTTTPCALATDGLRVETRTNLNALPEFTAGDFEAQDEGSQLLAELCGDAPDLVIDLCAGAGGKTLALAAQMGNRGRVVACDIDGRKLGELRKRARRAGLTTVEPLHLDGGAWPDALERRRDQAARVLVDAPCSGVGALRRNPETRWRLREADLATFAATQVELARRAAALLAPGGRMIYATCTILSEENQAVVAEVARARGLRIVPLAEAWDARAAAVATADGQFLQVDPDRHGTDGFFAAVLERPRAGA
ncbi:MAG: RsmB/NOP family class I SAM-dependent RNA methyltransferase [Myxococcales bacterium]|nr:RsmB/NOP family class I SAM-dependent RNA methyltransferase [Myxococcales bacterium]